MATTEWLRHDVDRSSPLETAKEFIKRRKMTMMVFRSNTARYYDWFRDMARPVKVENGRTQYFLPDELDSFIDRIEANNRPRSRGEVVGAEVARLEDWVKEKERAEGKRRGEWERAKKDLTAAQQQLRSAKEVLELLQS